MVAAFAPVAITTDRAVAANKLIFFIIFPPKNSAS
jgi:hypothetical protein